MPPTTPKTRPTSEQLSTLRGFEKIAFEVSDRINRTPIAKRAAHTFLRTVGAGWVHHFTKNLRHVEGLNELAALDPTRGVMIVANHRSFFDLYVIAGVLLRSTSWVDEMYFPVRSDFFYERASGVAVNAVMSAMAMYPPVLRRAEARSFNQYTVELLAELAARRGVVIGMHPEGTRNKTDDPYTLLPAQPGVGQIAYLGRPIVVPIFIAGLGNDIVQQVRGNFDGTGAPITMHIGAPLDLERWYAEPARMRTYKRIADAQRDAVMSLAQRDRAYRERHGLPSIAPKGVGVRASTG